MKNNMKYIYRVSDHSVKEINEVYVDNIRKTTGFTLYTGQSGNKYPGHKDQAIVVFDALSKKDESEKA